ncbi:MAG: metallophosphoesterase family protein [Candidatus Asgardarchaeia archaeon]
MKLIEITDLHGNYSVIPRLVGRLKIERADLVIICGDITHFGTVGAAKAIINKFSGDWKLLFIPGNCDPPELINLEKIGNALNIHEKVVQLYGFDFIGVGGAPITPFMTPIEFEEDYYNEVFDELREKMGKNKAILCSHCPPYGTKIDVTYRGQHVGSKKVREFILENENIVLSLNGHIHEASGIDYLGEVKLVNPGPAKNGFYAVIELDDLSVEIKKV